MLSIDVGSKKVCVIEGNYRNGIVSVSSFGEIEYEGETVVNGTINDRPALSFLINEIIKTNHMKSSQAIVTINSSDIIAREFTFPNVNPQSLKLLVNNEMARIIHEENGYIIDYIVTGVTAENMLNVIAYSVPSEMISGYYSLMKELKLSPYALDIHTNAMSKLLTGTTINNETHENSNIIIADIGYSRISFHGFSNGAFRFNRSDISPVQEFVREIGSIKRADINKTFMSTLDLSPNAVNDEVVITDTCRYFIYRLSEEIQKYIQYIIMNSESKIVEKIYICGGISSAKGIENALTESLKTPVETIKTVGRVNLQGDFNLSAICNAAGALIRL